MTIPPGPQWGQFPPQPGPPFPPLPRSSLSGWIKRNKLATGAGSLVLVLVVAAIGFATYRSIAPANDLLPATPSGWTRLATISGSRSQETNVTLHGVQLQICWVAKGGSIASLSYAIGTPANGPTPLYGENGSQSTTGCLFDPGNDTGTETFAVYEMGIGNYAVSLNEQLTPSQEAALNRQAARQAAQQAAQQQAQAAQQAAQQQAQAQATAESNVDQAAQTVASDLKDVISDTATVNGDVSGVSTAIKQEQADLATTQQASAAVVAAGNNSNSGGSSCSNAYTVQSDAYTVQSDAYSVQSALGSLSNDLSTLQGDLSTLESDQNSYLSVASSVSGYTSSYEPSSGSITSAEAVAQAAIKAGSSVNTAGMTPANQLVSQAKAAARAALNAGC